MPATLSPAVQHLFATGVIGGLLAIQMIGWLDPEGLPLFDFPGYVAVADDIRNQISETGTLSDWTVSGFSGTSRFTSHFKELLSLPLVVGLGALAGTQLTIYLFKLAAGLVLYGAFSHYLRAPGIGVVAGYAYIGSMSASYSTQNSDVILSFVLFPLIFITAMEMYRQQSRAAAICLGVLMACQFATNMVHALTATLIPIFLGIFRPWTHDEGAENPVVDRTLGLTWLRRALLAVAVFGCLSSAQIAWFVWDQKHHAAHDPEYVKEFVNVYSEPSPFLLVNRANVLGPWLDHHRTPFQEKYPADSVYGQHHYLGIVSLAILLVGWTRARRTLALRRAYQLFGLLFVIQWGLAMGPHSLLWQLAEIFSWRAGTEGKLRWVLASGSLVALAFALREAWRAGGQITKRVEIGAAAALVLGFIPSSLFLGLQSAFSFFDHFRAPGKYMELLPFAFYPAMGIGLVALVRAMPEGWPKRCAPIMALALILADTWPAQRVFDVDHTLAPVVEFRERVAKLSDEIAPGEPEGRLGIWPFASPSLWTEPSWIATASSLHGAWGWLMWQAGEYYRPFYTAAFRGDLDTTPNAGRADARTVGNSLSRIARVRYLISEHNGGTTPHLSPPWQSIARNERFELWKQPDIEPMSVAYRGHLIASGVDNWPMIATIARSHEKGTLMLMGDGKGARPSEVLRETASLDLVFSRNVVLPANASPAFKFGVEIQPGRPYVVDGQPSRGRLRRFLAALPPRETTAVVYTRPSPDEIQLEVAAGNEPATVFISESFHPGWRATVDGKEVPVLRAQLTFMAIPVDEGDHTIEMRFTPPLPVRVADAVSRAGWLAFPLVGLGWSIAVRRASAVSKFQISG
jgi:hypothetical protein